jgi:hypothetical protein
MAKLVGYVTTLYYCKGHIKPLQLEQYCNETSSVRNSGNVSVFYSESVQFESRSEKRLSWVRFFMSLLSPSRWIWGQYFKIDHNSFLSDYYQFALLYDATVRFYVVWVIGSVVKWTTNEYITNSVAFETQVFTWESSSRSWGGGPGIWVVFYMFGAQLHGVLLQYTYINGTWERLGSTKKQTAWTTQYYITVCPGATWQPRHWHLIIKRNLEWPVLHKVHFTSYVFEKVIRSRYKSSNTA